MITDVQQQIRHPVLRWMAATLDGRIEGSGERAKSELKSLVPDDAQQAIGHGVRAKRSKSGAITVELLHAEDGHAAV